MANNLTTILSISEQVSINDQRFVGQIISRNEHIVTSEVITVVPFQFEFQPMNYLLYSKNRSLLANLRKYDRALEQYLNFASTGWINYIQYQGDLTSYQISTAQWQTSTMGKNLVLGNFAGGISPTAYVVRTGDFCQVGNYSYIATADVVRGSLSTVTIPVHRTVLTTVASPINAVIGEYGTTVSMGGTNYTGVTFPVILQQYPTYALIPMTNDSFIQWASTFKAFESIT